MTSNAKILVDECLSKPAIEALLPLVELSSVSVEIAHQLDVYGMGADDTMWIPQAATDGWTIVTADRGTHSRVEAKLPLLCEAYGVTHVLLGAGLNKRNMAFKALRFVSHLEEIIVAAMGAKGCRYSLQLTTENSTRLTLVKSPTPDDVRKVQTRLNLSD